MRARKGKKGASASAPSKGYSSADAMAYDAFLILNELMGELHAARLIFLFASDGFFKNASVIPIARHITSLNQVYMRRLALLSVGSTLFKYQELYENLLSPFGCADGVAKKIFKKSKGARLENLRHISHHILDKKTKKHHSVEKIHDAFVTMGKVFSDLFGHDSSELIGEFEMVRNALSRRYPGAEKSVADRDRDYKKLEPGS